MNTTYKKITLDYLIRVIRAINQGEKLEFSTAPYEIKAQEAPAFRRGSSQTQKHNH